MIMITAIVTIMVTAIISTVSRYVAWQISVMGNPLYKFVIWHLIIFSIVLALFYDSRQGFNKSIRLLGCFAAKHRQTNQKAKVSATMTVYREHAKKFRPRAILMPIAATLFVAYILSSQMLFLAIVTSGSMEPTFKKGDLVIMQNILTKPIVGDIIIFPDPEGIRVGSSRITVTHRIVEVSGDKIMTQGDNNPRPDSWSVNRKTILGTAIIFNKKPVVIKDVGKYFLLDFTTTQYNQEFIAIAKTIQNLRAMGIMVFFICIVMYLFLSIRDARPSRYLKNR